MKCSRWIRFTALLSLSLLLSNDLAFAKKRSPDPAALKAKIQERGIGRGVRVMLSDKTEDIGMIVSVGVDSFVLKPKQKSAQPMQIEYAHLTEVHEDKLGRGEKIGVAVAVVSGVIAITAIVFAILISHSR